MERKILFKAKKLSDGKWVEGSLVTSKQGTFIATEEDASAFPMTMDEVDPSTVCQFTGLKDKNGVEIWEHDFITSPLGHSSEVIFLRGCFVIRVETGIVYLTSMNYGYVKNYGSKFDRKENKK